MSSVQWWNMTDPLNSSPFTTPQRTLLLHLSANSSVHSRPRDHHSHSTKWYMLTDYGVCVVVVCLNWCYLTFQGCVITTTQWGRVWSWLWLSYEGTSAVSVVCSYPITAGHIWSWLVQVHVTGKVISLQQEFVLVQDRIRYLLMIRCERKKG